MLYEFPVTAPANTDAAHAIEQEVTLIDGVVTQVDVQFPRGCVGLVHAYVRDKLHQIWPSNPDGTLAADDAIIRWPDEQEVWEKPYKLVLGVWNLDDSYPHTVTFRFALTPKHIHDQRLRAAAGLDYLARWYEQNPVV